MNGLIMNFGDVFSFCDELFVFLAEAASKKIVYAIKIHDQESSRNWVSNIKRLENNPNLNLNNPALTFVVLNTTQMNLKDCIVRFHPYERDSHLIGKPTVQLDGVDLDKIKKEILDGNFPDELKEKLSLTT